MVLTTSTSLYSSHTAPPPTSVDSHSFTFRKKLKIQAIIVTHFQFRYTLKHMAITRLTEIQ
uniref:Uncharacterized protein n=1 Tax=Arundo donax TaxID=35708 RepID=A0A0A9EF43_ARUDO